MSNQIQKQPLPGFVTRNDNRPPQMRMWLYVIATLLVLGFGVGVRSATTDNRVRGEGEVTIHSGSWTFSGICSLSQSLRIHLALKSISFIHCLHMDGDFHLALQTSLNP